MRDICIRAERFNSDLLRPPKNNILLPTRRITAHLIQIDSAGIVFSYSLGRGSSCNVFKVSALSLSGWKSIDGLCWRQQKSKCQQKRAEQRSLLVWYFMDLLLTINSHLPLRFYFFKTRPNYHLTTLSVPLSVGTFYFLHSGTITTACQLAYKMHAVTALDICKASIWRIDPAKKKVQQLGRKL